jgi:hypothetical protein
VYEEAVGKLLEVISMLRAVNPPSPRLEVLSLSSAMSTGERFRTLTSFRVTRIPLQAVRDLAWVFQAYESVGAEAITRSTGTLMEKAVVTTYLRGKASIVFLSTNMSGEMILLPVDAVIAELNIILVSLRSLIGLSGKLTEIAEAGEYAKP